MSGERRTVVVIALTLLALSAGVVGVLATFTPLTFYRDFPFVSNWVDLLPPYNQHLVTDVGELNLALALLFGWAALRPRRELVIPLCVAWALADALHLLYHVTHLQRFSVGDAAAQTASLVYLLLLPVAAIVACRENPG